jgi:hypothetical protein
MAVIADRNAGYEGSVNTAEWAKLVGAGMGARRSVIGAGSLKVTQGSGDRGLTIAAGTALGDGVLSTWDTPASRAGAAVGSGSRWDTVVARRDWTTSQTSIVVLAGGTSKALAAGLQNDPGQTMSDQPLALVRFSSTSTVVQEIIDLRTWVGDGGGLVAASDDALQYLTAPGTTVRIGNTTWARLIDGSGVPYWSRTFEGGGFLGIYSGTFADMSDSTVYGSGVKVWNESTRNVATLSIPDPGVPYRVMLLASGQIGKETTAATRFDFDLVVGATTIKTVVNEGASAHFQTWKDWVTLPSAQVFTGSTGAFLRARRISGSGLGAYSSSPTPHHFQAALFAAA